MAGTSERPLGASSMPSPRASHPPRSWAKGRALPGGVADEHGALDRSLGRELRDLADPFHVVLVIDHPGLERGPLLGEEDARERAVGYLDGGGQADCLELVLGVSGVVLLPERMPDNRVRLHEDSRLCPILATQPAPFPAGD